MSSTSYIALDGALAKIDKEGVANLDEIARCWPPKQSLLRHLVDLAEVWEPTLQSAVTGLLKRYADGGTIFSRDLSIRMLELLASAGDWVTRLHLLQILPRLEIPKAQAEPLCDCLLACLRDGNKFVRAWAYGGLHYLAQTHCEYRRDAQMAITCALRSESASIRAHLRQLAPLGRKETITSKSHPPDK